MHFSGRLCTSQKNQCYFLNVSLNTKPMAENGKNMPKSAPLNLVSPDIWVNCSEIIFEDWTVLKIGQLAEFTMSGDYETVPQSLTLKQIPDSTLYRRRQLQVLCFPRKLLNPNICMKFFSSFRSLQHSRCLSTVSRIPRPI
jgi:hypothetical protein